jgi:hypothetical protein
MHSIMKVKSVSINVTINIK